MDTFNQLLLGFGVALKPLHLLYCFFGAALGTLIGVLPGIGPVATIAMLLPITFTLPPVAALIMLAGIYYGVNMAAQQPLFWSICPEKPPPSSPAWTATLWPGKAGQAPP